MSGMSGEMDWGGAEAGGTSISISSISEGADF